MSKKYIQKTIDFDVIKKFESSNAAVTELRTGIFAPIKQITKRSKTYEEFVKNNRSRKIPSSWGDVLITGNILTQVHRDLLDCIFSEAYNLNELEGGAIAVYFSTTQVLRAYGDKSEKNLQWLKLKLREIRNTSIEVGKPKTADHFSFNILSKSAYSEKHESWGIVFTPDYRKFFEQELTINYKAELPKLLKIESALLKAIIRFFWTHNNMTFDMVDLLETLGYPLESERQRQRAIKEIKDNEIMLKEYGIIYEPKTKLIYRKDSFENKITFSNGRSSSKEIE